MLQHDGSACHGRLQAEQRAPPPRQDELRVMQEKRQPSSAGWVTGGPGGQAACPARLCPPNYLSGRTAVLASAACGSTMPAVGRGREAGAGGIKGSTDAPNAAPQHDAKRRTAMDARRSQTASNEPPAGDPSMQPAGRRMASLLGQHPPPSYSTASLPGRRASSASRAGRLMC